jgi:hypothetical protein
MIGKKKDKSRQPTPSQQFSPVFRKSNHNKEKCLTVPPPSLSPLTAEKTSRLLTAGEKRMQENAAGGKIVNNIDKS